MLLSLSPTLLSSLPYFLICTLLTHALELEGGGKPDRLIDLPPPPFSDSAVIHILINVWGGGLEGGPAGTRDNLSNHRYKNQT